jgi:alpha-glucosidase
VSFDAIKEGWMTSRKSPWREAVVYQIYPWTFNEDGERDQRGHGSLKGIIEKLDYLHDLGVDAIWLSPFYDSPMVDGGYDIRDYTAIHPDFGNMTDFEAMVNACHERGIRVMVDFIPNHSSDKHQWFEKSRNREPGFEDWYIWHPGNMDENGERTPPNNWASVFSASNRKARDRGEMPWLSDGDWTPYVSAWTYDDTRGEYYLHSFAKEQPDLNWSNVFVREAMKEVIRFWMRKGVDGFRVDAINYVGKNMEFPDEEINKTYSEDTFYNPFDQLRRYNASGYPDALHQYVWELCEVLKEEEFMGRDLRMVLEAYMTESELYRLDTIAPGIATTFNFGAMSLDWDAAHHKKQTDYYYTRLVPTAVGNQVNGNHDRPRLATRLGDRRARTAAVMNLFMPGMRFIYNGEELGFHNADLPDEKLIDRHEYRDGERTPMVWDDTRRNAGFSDADTDKLWLPMNTVDYPLAAARQSGDQRSSYVLYRMAIRLCRQLTAVQQGVYVPYESSNPHVFVYGRRHETQEIVVLVNFSSDEQTAIIDDIGHQSGQKILSSITVSDVDARIVDIARGLVLQPDEAIVVLLQSTDSL